MRSKLTAPIGLMRVIDMMLMMMALGSGRAFGSISNDADLRLVAASFEETGACQESQMNPTSGLLWMSAGAFGLSTLLVRNERVRRERQSSAFAELPEPITTTASGGLQMEHAGIQEAEDTLMPEALPPATADKRGKTSARIAKPMTLIGQATRDLAGMQNGIGQGLSDANLSRAVSLIYDIAFQCIAIALSISMEEEQTGESCTRDTGVADEASRLGALCEQVAKTISQLIDDASDAGSDGLEESETVPPLIRKIVEGSMKFRVSVGGGEGWTDTANRQSRA